MKSIALVSVLFFSACRCNPCNDNGSQSPKPIAVAPHQPVVNAIKIVLLPVNNLSQYPDGIRRLDDALFSAMSASRRFDVRRDQSNFETCDTESLADRIRRLQNSASAVVLATIEEYEPYPRPRLTVRVEMFRTLDGIRVATLTGHFDSADKATSDAVRKSYFSISDSRYPGSTDVVFDSPEMYFRYASAQMTASLIRTLDPSASVATLPSVTKSH